MPELVRVEPALFRPDEQAWFVYDDGRKCLRPLVRETVERGPSIISDHIDAVMSHADGRMYDSKSALARTYRPDGNPQGVRYECIGEHVAKPFARPKEDPRRRHAVIERTLQEMGI